MRLRSVAIVSNLQLQRLLYFNVFASLAYGACEIGLTAYKLAYLQLPDKAKYSTSVLVAVWVLCELARLPLGYAGNLREKVSQVESANALCGSRTPSPPISATLPCVGAAGPRAICLLAADPVPPTAIGTLAHVWSSSCGELLAA